MKLKPINQQVVVVMGASSGIGRAAALRFAAKGAAVVVAARNQKGLDAVVAEIRGKGGKAVAVTADTADANQVKAVADRAVAEFGRIDTWAHVAGVGLYGTVEQIPPADYERLVEVNLLGQIYGALAALPHLRAEGRGALVHVSAVDGGVSFPLTAAYAASKRGMTGFLDALRAELEREGAPISVVNVMPASIDTPFFENAHTHLGVAPHAVPPVYAPEIVAAAIVEAAERPAANVVIGGSGAGLLAAQRVAPRLVQELMVGPIGFEAQLSRRPKGIDAPNNLFTPTPDQNLGIHGDAHRVERRTSLYTRIETSAPVRLVRRATRPLIRLLARTMGALYVARFRKQLAILSGGAPTAPAATSPTPPVSARIAAPITRAARMTRRVGRAQAVKIEPQPLKIEPVKEEPQAAKPRSVKVKRRSVKAKRQAVKAKPRSVKMQRRSVKAKRPAVKAKRPAARSQRAHRRVVRARAR